MGKVFINESTLTDIGDAIRTKTGGSKLIAPLDMASEIEGIKTGDLSRKDFIPDTAFILTEDCSYRFSQNSWNWFIELYGDEIITEDLVDTVCMFSNTSLLKKIPFDFNFRNIGGTGGYYADMFSVATQLRELGKLRNMYPRDMSSMFYSCFNLRSLPEIEDLDLSYIYANKTSPLDSMFQNCYSLRNIPEELLKRLYCPLSTSYYATIMYGNFKNCYVLDEIKGLNPQTGRITSNMFNGVFSGCYRIKNLIFATQEDGTPYSVEWKSQKIDLSNDVGYYSSYNLSSTEKNITTGYNSGITADKRVYDDATYQALKNDADWYAMSDTKDIARQYGRYNHDSAVNTINSLPDTSAYLATAGGTNTLTFRGEAGSKTDGGAINTLTAEEIAVATAKGWTVTLV